MICQDAIVTTRLATLELCRLFHGIDCQLRCDQRPDLPRLDHLALAFGFVGRLYAIRCTLHYDLNEQPTREFHGAAALLWESNFKSWRLAALP